MSKKEKRYTCDNIHTHDNHKYLPKELRYCIQDDCCSILCTKCWYICTRCKKKICKIHACKENYFSVYCERCYFFMPH